jgi:hypothetical protein
MSSFKAPKINGVNQVEIFNSFNIYEKYFGFHKKTYELF